MTPDLAGSTPGAPYDYADYFGRVAYVSLLLLAAPAWVYLVARAATPGALRCLACAPALAALLLAPFLFSYEHEPLSIMAAAYLSERLPATKVLAFCLGRGPLQEHLPRCGLIHFIALTLCPVVLMAAGPAAVPSKSDTTAIAATQQQPQQLQLGDPADAAVISTQQQQHVTRATRRHHHAQLSGGDAGGDPGGAGSAPSQPPAQSPLPVQHLGIKGHRLPDAPHAHTATAAAAAAAGGGRAGSCRPQGPLFPTSREQLCTGLAAKACVLLLVCVLAKQLPTLHVLARSRPMHALARPPLPDQSCPADIVASLEPSCTTHTQLVQLVQQLSRSPAGSALLPWAQLGAHVLQGVQVGRVLLAVGMFCAMAGLLELLLLAMVPLQQAGMQLAAPFNAPHRATSLAEFWSMRWNVPQTQLLKALVYDPIIEGCLVKQEQQQAQGQTRDAQPAACDKSGVNNVIISANRVCCNAGDSARGKPEGPVLHKQQQPPALLRVSGNSNGSSSSSSSSSGGRSGSRSRRRRAVAVVATFLFSGLEHLLFYWYVTRMLYLPWLLFFTMHGLLMVVESQVRRAARQRAQPPPQPSHKPLPPQQQQRQGSQQQEADAGSGLPRSGCGGSADLASPVPVDCSAVLGGGAGTEGAARLGPEVGDPPASEQQEGGDICSSITSSSSSSMSGNTVVSAGTAADMQWGADAGEQSLEAAHGADGMMGSWGGEFRGRLVQGAAQRAGSAQAGAGGPGGLPAAGGTLRQLSDEAASAGSGMTQGHQGKASHVQQQQMRSVAAARPDNEVEAASAACEDQHQRQASCAHAGQHGSIGHERQPGHANAIENKVPSPQPIAPCRRQQRKQSSAPQRWLCAALAHPAVWNVMTLVVLHASACWGFYGALEHPELVARVTRATCSLPGSSHWGPWLMSADACAGW